MSSFYKNPPPAGSPAHHRDCRHPKKDYSKSYCTLCWTLGPSNFPPLDSLPIDFAGPDDTTPSRPARPRAQPTRPRFTSGSLTKAAAAYPTPSSPPSPGCESDSNYFRGASTLGGSSVASKPTTRRAVKSLTTPQRGLPTRSSRSSPLHNPPTTLNDYGSDEDSGYGPPDSKSRSSDGSGTDGDGDSHSDVSSQESSEEAEETEED
ncbi:hypothetical protein B0H14DRAFT_3729309 [Mycena olivaceomarginata]|nr:hypothetical protein B0H14DRAFT_3729309 [Mycena olivaceomarginata]